MRFLGFVFVAIVLVVGGVWFFLDPIIKSSTETFGSKLTGTSVTLDSVHVSLLNGHALITGLQIANPAGFSADNAVSLGKIEVKLIPASIFSDRIHVETIEIDSPQITYELNEKGTNIDMIMAHIAKSTGQQNKAAAPTSTEQTTAEQTPARNGKKVQIDRVSIKNTHVVMSASLLGNGGKGKIDVPEIVLKDIGAKQDGATLSEAVQAIFTPLMGSVTALSASDMAKMQETVKGIKEDITTGLKGIGDSIKGFLNKQE